MIFRLQRLKHAITAEHHCRAEHAGSKLVVDRTPAGALWRARVEIFDLVGHPHATRCYAWTEEVDARTVVRTALRTSSATSAQAAVHAALHTRTSTSEEDTGTE